MATDTPTAPPTEQEQNYTPVPPSGFGALASDIYGAPLAAAREQRSAAGAREVEAIRAKGEATRPLIESAQAGLARPLPEPPKGPVLPPPPSRQLHDFLAPVEGEPPERSVMKLISALSVMGTGIGGLAKGDARAALAGMTGALKGWQEGEKDRADRAFSDWEAATARLLKNYEIEHRTYRDIMEDANLTNEQRLTAVKLAALAADNPILAAKAEVGNWDAVIGDLMQAQQHADTVAHQQAVLIQSAELRREADTRMREMEAERIRQRELDRQQREQQAKDALEERRREADQRHQERRREFDAKMQGDEGIFTPESLEFMARQYYATGNLPPMGMGKASTEARVKILNRAAAIAAESGTSAEDQVSRSQFAKGVQTALNANMRQQSMLGSFIATANKNIAMAKELSDKVDRTTGAPILDKWILAGRRAIAGDADVTNFDLINASVAAEFARVMNSATGGGVSTVDARRHAQELLNTAMTKDQYRQALDTIHAEIMNRAESFSDTTKALQDAVKKGGLESAPGSAASTKGAPPKPGMVRVKRKSDGATGWLDKKDLGDLYELVQ